MTKEFMELIKESTWFQMRVQMRVLLQYNNFVILILHIHPIHKWLKIKSSFVGIKISQLTSFSSW